MADKTVAELQSEISELQNTIIKIQSECQHPGHDLVMWSWRPGALNPSRICTACRAQVAGITPEESKQVWDEFHGIGKNQTNG